MPVLERGLLMMGGVCCRDARSVDEFDDKFAFDNGVRIDRCALLEFALRFFLFAEYSVTQFDLVGVPL